MTTLRSLIAELGFQVDTTPADRFNAAVNKSKNNLKGLSQVNLGGFNKKLKAGFTAAKGIILTGLGGITGLLTADAAAKIIRIEGELRLGFKGLFDPLRAEIDDILTDPLLKNLTTEIELLEAAAKAAGQGINRAFIIENLRNVLELSTVFRKNMLEGTGLFIDFIKTGDLDLFLRLGKFTAAQEQFFQKSKTTPGELGVPARRILLANFFQEFGPDINKQLQDVIAKGGLTQKQLLNTLDKLAVEIGEKTLPAFQELNKELIPFIEKVTRFVKGEVKAKEFIPAPEELNVESQIINKIILKFPKLFIGLLKQARSLTDIPSLSELVTKSGKRQKIQTSPFAPGLPTQFRQIDGTISDQSNTTTNEFNTTIIVEQGATADGNTIKAAVKGEFGKLMGRIAQQSKNTRLIRGSGEGR